MARRNIIWPGRIWMDREVILISLSVVTLFSILILSAYLLKLFINEGLIFLAFYITAGGAAALGLPVLYFGERRRLSLMQFGFRWPGWIWIPITVLASVLVMFIGGGLSNIWTGAFYSDIEPMSGLFVEMKGEGVWLNIIYFKLFVAILVPIAEEVFFRGVIFRFIRQQNTFFISASLSALLFAAVHFSLELIPFLIVLGFTSAFLFEYTRSILMPIFLHFAVNNFAVNFYLLSEFSGV